MSVRVSQLMNDWGVAVGAVGHARQVRSVPADFACRWRLINIFFLCFVFVIIGPRGMAGECWRSGGNGRGVCLVGFFLTLMEENKHGKCECDRIGWLAGSIKGAMTASFCFSFFL